jgi:hypothetical protein
MVAPLLIDGAMNGETFRAYIEQFAVPILKHNDIVVLIICQRITLLVSKR